MFQACLVTLENSREYTRSLPFPERTLAYGFRTAVVKVLLVSLVSFYNIHMIFVYLVLYVLHHDLYDKLPTMSAFSRSAANCAQPAGKTGILYLHIPQAIHSTIPMACLLARDGNLTMTSQRQKVVQQRIH